MAATDTVPEHYEYDEAKLTKDEFAEYLYTAETLGTQTIMQSLAAIQLSIDEM